MAKVRRICANKKCGAAFTARSADVARGWGRFCSKSCKAVKQEARTGQYASFLRGGMAQREFDPHDHIHPFSEEAFSGF